MKVHTFLPAIVLALGATHASADAPKHAEIPFANMGAIRDWQADGDQALYVQGRNQQWYHAELMGPCMELPFAERIGFVVEPSGDFDRWSSIVVRGQQCVLTSFTESGPPP
ncbi:MAG TPA: DUF6491 family protein [Steroidobacteraceae bacterium]|jgi:hypothetical protein|nr:DUF6491 family protein [Steroidobacteraceae bacterium]